VHEKGELSRPSELGESSFDQWQRVDFHGPSLFRLLSVEAGQLPSGGGVFYIARSRVAEEEFG
jgi:hypothetical protein